MSAVCCVLLVACCPSESLKEGALLSSEHSALEFTQIAEGEHGGLQLTARLVGRKGRGQVTLRYSFRWLPKNGAWILRGFDFGSVTFTGGKKGKEVKPFFVIFPEKFLWRKQTTTTGTIDLDVPTGATMVEFGFGVLETNRILLRKKP